MAKKNRSKKAYPPVKQKKFALPLVIKQKFWGLILVLSSLILALSFFDLAGEGGRGLKTLFLFLFGNFTFVFPLVLILSSLMFFNSRLRNNWLPLLAMVLLAIGGSAFLSVISHQGWGLGDRAGGWLGEIFFFPFFKIFGPWVSLIIFAGIMGAGALIVFYLLRPTRTEKLSIVKEEGEEVITRAQLGTMKKESPSLIKKLFVPRFKIRAIEPEARKKKVPLSQGKTATFTKEETREKAAKYQPPPLDLLESEKDSPLPGDIKINSAIIKRTLQNFDIPVEMADVRVGPTVTQYTFKPAEGIKLSKITALHNDLALSLASHPIRIEAPIPGQSLVGIEVPNKKRVIVRLRDLLEDVEFTQRRGLLLPLGRDVSGVPFFADLTKMPHLLISGATGTGKTIALHDIIISLIYQWGPEDLKFILVDPKRVDFAVYAQLPHLLAPVIFDAQKTINALKWLIGEMERRFGLLSQAKCRDIVSFNQWITQKQGPSLPYIILLIDELADLMASRGKEVEACIVRLAQMARAVGVHLVLSTQRPSVEVITGLIKANITSRISFRVASQVDSRTILDIGGAEKLLGLGDMLYLSPETKKPKRLQSPYLSEKEVKRVVNYLAKKATPPISEEDEELAQASLEDVQENLLVAKPSVKKQLLEELTSAEPLEKSLQNVLQEENKEASSLYFSQKDPLYEQARGIVLRAKKASASLLQRHLSIGYARAARLLDMLEEAGVVGPAEGAKPREVYGLQEEKEEDREIELKEPEKTN